MSIEHTVVGFENWRQSIDSREWESGCCFIELEVCSLNDHARAARANGDNVGTDIDSQGLPEEEVVRVPGQVPVPRGEVAE